MAFLKLRDYWTLKTLEVLDNKKNTCECKDSASPTGKSLLTRVAATHSGIVNGNARFYRPDRMQEGVSSWLPKQGYPRPVLLHHDEQGETLGRVAQAKYVDESYKYNTEFPILRDMQFYRTDSKKKNLFETVDWIVDNLQPLPDYTGLGYIELGLNITNPDAIARVLRDEYLTVSVGLTSDAFLCSVCHTDWAVDDKCDHKMGDVVDGKPVYMICGHLGYDEVSFVNHPADPFAGKIGKAELKDSLSKIFFLGLSQSQQKGLGISMTDSLYESDIHFEDAMEKNLFDFSKADERTKAVDEIKSDALTRERALELKQALSEWKPEAEDEKTAKRSLQSTVAARIRLKGWSKEVPGTGDAEAEEMAAALKDAEECTTCRQDGCDEDAEENWAGFEFSEEDNAFFADVEKLNDEIEAELDVAKGAGELTDEQVKDAKLSSEQRKKLKGSTFCGPNRSFPVPDCAHVTAARRLIGRAKVSEATKKKILSCVSAKASKLGCSGKKDEQTTATTTPPVAASQHEMLDALVASYPHIKDDATKLTDAGTEEKKVDYSKILTLIESLEKEYTAIDTEDQYPVRAVVGALIEKWYSDGAYEWYKTRLTATNGDAVVLSKGEVADKEDAINKLTEDVEELTKKVDASEKQARAAFKLYKSGMAVQIVMDRMARKVEGYVGLSDEQFKARVSELSARTPDSLKDTVNDIRLERRAPVTDAAGDPESKTEESAHQVDDNAQVSEPAQPAGRSAADAAASTPQAAREALTAQLQGMTRQERQRFLRDLEYESIKRKAQS